MDRSPPGSSVHEISQARIREWAAISSSRGSSPPRDQTCVSCIDRLILYHCAPGKPRVIPTLFEKEMKAVPEAEAAALEPGSWESRHEFCQLTSSVGETMSHWQIQRRKNTLICFIISLTLYI